MHSSIFKHETNNIVNNCNTFWEKIRENVKKDNVSHSNAHKTLNFVGIHIYSKTYRSTKIDRTENTTAYSSSTPKKGV